jgi:hypothetical protein
MLQVQQRWANMKRSTKTKQQEKARLIICNKYLNLSPNFSSNKRTGGGPDDAPNMTAAKGAISEFFGASHAFHGMPNAIDSGQITKPILNSIQRIKREAKVV